MSAPLRALEVARALGETALSFGPATAALLRHASRAAVERDRVAAALGRWDPTPAPAPKAAKPRKGRVFVIAGEPSGDRIAAGAVEAIRRRNPEVVVRGFGGPRFAAAGATLDHDLASDALMGVTAVLASAPAFVSLYARFLRVLDTERPDALLLVDYPGFNLPAAEAARRRGIPVVWYVVPQIWAWAPWRAARIGRAATDLCVVLPFERAFYEDRGVAAKYVGYPHFEDSEREPLDEPLAARLKEGGRPVLALLPGSRAKEIDRNLAPMLAAAAHLRTRLPNLRPVLACAAQYLRPAIDARIRAAATTGASRASGGTSPAVEVEVLDGGARTLLSVARAALCVSGTATVECLLAGVPAVVPYQLSAIQREILPFVLTAPRFALANLLAGGEVFPEYADPAGCVRSMSQDLEWLMAEGFGRDRALRTMRDVRQRLAAPGCHDRVAAVIEAHLKP